jgi:hypothetical protein
MTLARIIALSYGAVVPHHVPQPLPRKAPAATVTLPKAGATSEPLLAGRDPRADPDGAMPVRRRIPDEDVALIRRAVNTGHDPGEVVQDYLAAFVVEVRAAGGSCVEGPELVYLRSPSDPQLQLHARVAPVEVAQRLQRPAPPMLTPPGGVTTEESLRALTPPPPPPRRHLRLRAPRWTGAVLWGVAALVAAALWAPLTPWLAGFGPVQRLARLPWPLLVVPLLPWLAVPILGGWRWLRHRPRRPTHRRGAHR